ncbi:MAG: hypothetical protein KDA90_11395, partial [Planctomycetaceae bacterium]|nr:hypothetical protein [Planctomycetaceae bacterium]
LFRESQPMHPNAFLRTYWRLDLRPQIFVAMSFSSAYDQRFANVIKPAIEAVHINDQPLKAFRVDNSKTGDSILTDILEGIAHSQMVLADVSALGRDAVTGSAYRNGNVMYEIGLALACRQPQEVLLIRDDKERFLFDVSTIPHMHLNFGETDKARDLLRDELIARLRERDYFRDARVQLAIAQLTAEELRFLELTFEYERNTVWGRELKGLATWNSIATSRLLDKQVIQIAGQFDNDKKHVAFMFTELGWIVQQRVKTGLPRFNAPTPAPIAPSKDDGASDNAVN